MRIVIIILCAIHGTCALLSDGIREKYMKDFPQRLTFKDGDLLIGGLFSIHNYDEAEFCSGQVFEPAVYHAMAMEFAINKINADSLLLPNLTLGFVILDECRKVELALTRVSHFIPDKSEPMTSEVTSNKFPFYDVIGLVGPATSSSAELVSKVLGFYQIPHISFFATKCSLSDKTTYPYFLRTVPEDCYQATTISEILNFFGWTYVSGVYQGAYGYDGLLIIEKQLALRGGCFAKKIEITKSTDTVGYLNIIAELLSVKAKVVVLYATVSEAKNFLTAFNRLNAEQDLIVVASDGLGGSTLDEPHSVEKLPEGLLVINPFSNSITDFDNFLMAKTGRDAQNDMILHDFWELKFGCKFSNGTCDLNDRFTSSRGFYSDSSVSLVVDAVYTYAYAVQKIVHKLCPHGNKAAYRACVKGPEILSEMKKVDFNGYVGRVTYGDNGNMAAKFEVRGIKMVDGIKRAVRVASLNTSSLYLDANITDFHWHSNFSHLVNGKPQSICSLPCGLGQQKTRSKNTCCWVCEDCRVNEITSFDDNCRQCPDMTWPNENRTQCESIPPDFISTQSGQFIALVAAATFGILMNLTLMALFITNNNHALMRASGRELMYMIFFGCYATLGAVFVLLIRPNIVVCYCNYLSFSLSFTLIYAPLVTKTRRIYVIFSAGKKSTRPPMAISQSSQIIITGILILIQIVLCCVSVAVWPPNVNITMPDPYRRYAELSCQFSNTAFALTISYNCLLVLVCSVLAYKARITPENFNESRFISFSVYTTLILFVTFIPMYIHIEGVLVKVMILSLMLLLNAYVVIFCLFAPKIYAVYYATESSMSSTSQSRHCLGLGTTRVQVANGVEGTSTKRKLERSTTIS